MKKSELIKLAQALIGSEGVNAAKAAYAAEPRLKEWLDQVAYGLYSAYQKEKVFGSAQRRWFIQDEGNALSFLREERHDIPGGWDAMGESFRVFDPDFIEYEEG